MKLDRHQDKESLADLKHLVAEAEADLKAKKEAIESRFVKEGEVELENIAGMKAELDRKSAEREDKNLKLKKKSEEKAAEMRAMAKCLQQKTQRLKEKMEKRKK